MLSKIVSLKSIWVSALALAMMAGTVQAQEVSPQTKQTIETQLKQLIPNAPEIKILPTPVADLFEVAIGPKVVYVSADGKVLVDGAMVDLTTRINLTEVAEKRARKGALDAMDVKSMIVYPAKGEAKHVVTIFTDVDCPYCHKLHKEVPKLNDAGIEVRYLAYPRAGMASPTFTKMVSAWCANNPQQALDDVMAGKPVESAICEHPIADHMAQAQLFGVNGTPNMVLDDGEMVPGYVPAEKLIPALNAPVR